MDINAWLTAAIADAERRGLGDLRPLLETLARSTTALREAEGSARPDTPTPGTNLPPTGEHQE